VIRWLGYRCPSRPPHPETQPLPTKLCAEGSASRRALDPYRVEKTRNRQSAGEKQLLGARRRTVVVLQAVFVVEYNSRDSP
jgi:hypothetical protein